MTRSLFPLLLPIFVLFVVAFVRRPATVDRRVVRRTTDVRCYFESVRRRAQARALLPLTVALLVALIAGTILLGRWLSRNAPVAEPAPRVQTLA